MARSDACDRRFWMNAIQIITPSCQRRFIQTFQSYLDAVVQEAEDRNSHRIRDVESYFDVRRDTIGAWPAIALCEMYMNIPDAIMNHPAVWRMCTLAVDLILISNDLCSYNVESATRKSSSSHNH